MYAIVQTGGKQYKVQTGDQVKVEKLVGEHGSEIELDQVLAVATPEGLTLGKPLLTEARVKATIVRTARDRKIIVFKKKRRQGYHKKQGHRQWYTLIRIDTIQQSSTAMETSEPAAKHDGEKFETKSRALSKPISTMRKQPLRNE
jgi:large subunit ribosomal protein L21